MLRKFPPQTNFSKAIPQQFNPGMQQMMPQMMQNFPQQFQQNQMNMFPTQNMQKMMDISKMDPSVKREYLGEILFGKISTNPNFASISEYVNHY